MQLDDTTQQELHKRLRRIEGQIRGIARRHSHRVQTLH